MELLLHKGFAPGQVASIRCPIGIDGLSGKHPREIAIAVAAELLLLRGKAAVPVETAVQTA